MNTQTVTLQANDTYNLTTGQVTRSAPSRPAPVSSHTDPSDTRARILADSRKRAARNDMQALAYIMRYHNK